MLLALVHQAWLLLVAARPDQWFWYESTALSYSPVMSLGYSLCHHLDLLHCPQMHATLFDFMVPYGAFRRF